MSDLGRRLAKLESTATGGRCAVCADWPPSILLYSEEDPWGRPSRLDGPERCSTCGWEPVIIRLVYTDDWRATGGLPPQGSGIVP